MAYNALNGPSKTFALSVGTSTPVLVEATTAHPERYVITLQADGKFYVYFADEGETPNAATVQAKGMWQGKNSKESYEASSGQAVYVLSFSSTIEIRGAERG